MITVGDSTLNGTNENGLSRNGCIVTVRPHSGATTEDLTDHIQPVAGRKPDTGVLHIGTNDLTIQYLERMKS